MAQKSKILVVEDEESILKGLLDLFVFNGFEVEGARTGTEGLKMATENQYALMILDVMLPEMDGFTLCDRIRKTNKHVPIIMLTAKSEEDDIVQGLKLGADDYIAKPFSIKILLSRVQSLLRRSGLSHQGERYIELGGQVRVDTENLSVEHAGGRKEELTGLELEILLYLRQNLKRAISRDELLVKVWGYIEGSSIETRTVDIHIAKIRKKIELNPKTPQFLTTVRGKGYMLEKVDNAK